MREQARDEKLFQPVLMHRDWVVFKWGQQEEVHEISMDITNEIRCCSSPHHHLARDRPTMHSGIAW